MKHEINPKDSPRGFAFELWKTAGMPKVTIFKTFDITECLFRTVHQSFPGLGQIPPRALQNDIAHIVPVPSRPEGRFRGRPLLQRAAGDHQWPQNTINIAFGNPVWWLLSGCPIHNIARHNTFWPKQKGLLFSPCPECLRTHADRAAEEGAEMALVPEPQLVCYFLHRHIG